MDPGVDAEVSAQLLLFAEQTADFVGVADAWGRVLYLNPAARKRLGIADPSGLTLADVFPLDEFAFYYEVARPQLLRTGAWSGEVRVNVAGEGALPMYLSTSAKLGPGGEINGLVVYAREVLGSDPVRVTGESEVDDATGLLRPSAFDDRVRRALAAVHRDGEACALVLVDIAGVTETIETVGHHAAATIVRSLAGRLARLARTTDTVGRVGEQRLGLLLGAVRSQGEALRIAQTACASLVDAPITTASGDVVPSVCWGAAVGKAGDDPTVLIERASAAMANGSARSHVDVGAPAAPKRFDPSASMDDFRVGLSHGDVQPYVRGVVDLDSERLVGYRGIARWHHRRLGMLEASEFIDGIADTTLASQVDLYVARETAAVVTLAVADSPLRLYTPVSRRLLADVRTEQYLSEIADAFFLSMNQMHLQIARPLLERWSPALHDALASLRDAPVALVLTGVEHLADARELAAYPFHELHIARRLTTSLIADPEARHAVSEIVRFAHDNGLVVGAAGVDNEHDRDLLIDAGCDVASGDLFGAARPANTVD